jgi:hypothetical protein
LRGGSLKSGRKSPALQEYSQPFVLSNDLAYPKISVKNAPAFSIFFSPETTLLFCLFKRLTFSQIIPK